MVKGFGIMKKSKIFSLAIWGLSGATLMFLANNSNSQTALALGGASVNPTSDGHVVYSAPVSAAWALAYPDAAANLSATNANGGSNLQKMTELLPPDGQSAVVLPTAQTPGISNFSTNAILSMA